MDKLLIPPLADQSDYKIALNSPSYGLIIVISDILTIKQCIINPITPCSAIFLNPNCFQVVNT